MKKYNLILIVFLILFLATGCGKKNIVGKWKSVVKNNKYYYIFNKDKTCSYKMTAARLECTYEVNKNQLFILYKGNKTKSKFKYILDGDTLIIRDENNNYSEFIRQKEK